MSSKLVAKQIRLLGSPRFTDATGSPLPIMHNDKGIALIAYLIATGQTHSREAVADLLWDSDSTEKSRQNLRKLLSRISKMIDGLEVTRRHVSFVSDSDEVVDLYILKKALNIKDHRMLDEALKKVEGTLLDKFHLLDAPRFNEWLAIEAERVRQQIVSAFEQVCDAYFEEKNWALGIDAAQRWLAFDELEESALLHLMQILAASGQVGLALQQYEFTRKRLWDEIGVDPDPEIIALAQKLEELKAESGEGLAWAFIAGGEQFDWPEPGVLAEPGPLPVNSYLPYHRNNDFVGRESILLRMAELLLPFPDKVQPNGDRIAAITGMGGLGKTQLAVEYAYRYGRFYPGGVLWMNFAVQEQLDDEVANIGGEQGMALFQETEKLTLADRVGRVQRAWREPIPRLLIFDSCEAENVLAEWVPVTGGCRVLVTSLRASWARQLQINAVSLSILDAAESVSLLRNAVPGLSAEDALEIAEAVGHLPLALHLAGGFLSRYRQISPANYLVQLRNQGLFTHPSLQGRGVAFSPTGHELHVARTFVINLEKLDTEDKIDIAARKLLARAALFKAGEPIQRGLMLSTILKDEEDFDEILSAEDGLARLVTLGFLKVEGGERVIMHRLLAKFVQESMVISEAALLDVEQAVFEVIDSHFIEKSSTHSLNISAAHVRHLIDKSQNQPRIYNVKLTHHFGLYLQAVADFEGSRHYLLRSLDLYQQIYGEDHPDIAHCLNSLGSLYMRDGVYNEAYPFFEQALAMWERTLGEEHGQLGYSLNNIGYLLTLRGENEQAQPYLERALAIFVRDLGPNHPRTAIGLNNLGVALMNLGGLDEARPYLERALEIRETSLGEEHPYTVVSLQNIGLYYMKEGDFDLAEKYLARSLTLREKVLGKHPHTARSLNALGELDLARGDLDRAQSYLEQALKIQQEIWESNHPEKGLTIFNLGKVYRAQNDELQARSYFKQADVILRENVAATHFALQQLNEI